MEAKKSEFTESEVRLYLDVVIEELAINDAERNAEDEYDDMVLAMNGRRKVNQARCKHWFSTYHGDPAGGSDSQDVCNSCGKRL